MLMRFRFCRFRPNIVLKGAGVPFAEDMWRRIVLRPAQDPPLPRSDDESRTFTIVSKTARCLVCLPCARVDLWLTRNVTQATNVDPKTGERDAAVPLKVLLKFRTGKDPARMSKACFGCYAVVGGDGVLRVGDEVEVQEVGVVGV